MILHITDRNIKVDNAENQISYNSDYIAEFIFDGEWNGKIKTARFVQDGEYFDVVLVDDKCEIPPLKTGFVKVGVFSDSMTSTYADVYFKTSIKDGTGLPAEPPEDVVSQLTKLAESGMLKGKDGLDGKSAYEVAVKNGFVGTETEWLESLHGTDGKDGQNGADGKDGKDGQDGIDGEKGDPGEPGDDYVITEADYEAIADLASKKVSVPTKTSELQNDSGYLTTETDPTVPAWAKQANKPTYTALEVGARPNTWMPSASDVGADPRGTATSVVSGHNVATDTHNDIRQLITGLTTRLNTLADSDDTTLDQMSEIVAYLKANRTLIESVTTSKVSVSDIVDNLATNVSNKPLSAAQGVALKALIDAITVPTKVSQLENDSGYLTEHQDLSAYRKSTDQDSIDNAIKSEVSKIKSDLSTLSLGVHTDGLIYIFMNGQPVGTGVEQGTSGDVIGYVSSGNNIVLTGELAEGTYSLKYEMEDGSTVDIGELNISSAPSYTNLADPTSSDWGTDKRVGSDGTFRNETGTTVTNYIPIYSGQTVYIKGMDITTKACGIYNDLKAVQSVVKLESQTVYFTDISATETGGQATWNYAIGGTEEKPWYVRFGGILTGTANDVVITINEPIE